MSDKVPLILFSGGLDSTYLLQRQLADYGPADVLYVNGGQSYIKQKAELRSRRITIDLLNANYPHKVQAEWECLNSRSIANNPNHAWCQPAAWVTGALAVIDPDRHSELQIAYVADDGLAFGYNLVHIEKAWEHLQKISIKGEPVPLGFPLMFTKKVDILRKLDKRLLDSIWVCESPKDDKTPCGNCNPCMLLKNTLQQYRTKFSETVFTTKLLALRDFNDKFVPIDHTNPNYSRSRVGQDWYEYPITGSKRVIEKDIE